LIPHAGADASPWVRRHAALVKPGARVLDLAAGRGRHARFLASLGHDVLAVDRDAAALSALAGTNYLHRPSFDAMLSTLAGDGVLVYETFAAGNEAFGRPSSADFLLAAGELLDRVRGRLAVVAFEEGIVERGADRAVVQRLAAVGPGYARPWRLP